MYSSNALTFSIVFLGLYPIQFATYSQDVKRQDDSVPNGVLVFPFIDGCNNEFCMQFNAYRPMLTKYERTSILYNSCVCKCKDSVTFDSNSKKCRNSIQDEANSGNHNTTIRQYGNLANNVSTSSAILEIVSIPVINDTAYHDYDKKDNNTSVYKTHDNGLARHIWSICLCASIVLCVLFVYSAFEKRKQKRKQGNEQHNTSQSKYYAHEVAGVRKTLMECYNMPLIKARQKDEPKCDSSLVSRSRLSSEEDYLESLPGTKESFLHPKWESRPPSIKVTIVGSRLERLNEHEDEGTPNNESFGKWTPAYSHQLQPKRKHSAGRKLPSNEVNKASTIGKRFHSVGRRICASSTFQQLHRQKRGNCDAVSMSPIVLSYPTPKTQMASTDTVVNLNVLQEETAINAIHNV